MTNKNPLVLKEWFKKNYLLIVIIIFSIYFLYPLILFLFYVLITLSEGLVRTLSQPENTLKAYGVTYEISESTGSHSGDYYDLELFRIIDGVKRAGPECGFDSYPSIFFKDLNNDGVDEILMGYQQDLPDKARGIFEVIQPYIDGGPLFKNIKLSDPYCVDEEFNK